MATRVDTIAKRYGLTPKRARFVLEYMIDLNATQATIRAGYAKGSSSVQGTRLLANDKVQSALQDLVSKREERTGITADRVLQELADIAFLPGEGEKARDYGGLDTRTGDRIKALKNLADHLGICGAPATGKPEDPIHTKAEQTLEGLKPEDLKEALRIARLAKGEGA